MQSYRGFKQVWHAYPKTVPDLAIVREAGSKGCSTGYVSWNGATEVTGWEILEGQTAKKLSRVGRIGYEGFETKFHVSKSCVQAVTLYGNKKAAASKIVCVQDVDG